MKVTKKSQYSIAEHNFIFALMMASAGMMGAYTFIVRGNVFCNAQTANVVLMSIAIGQGRWMDGLYFLIPMSAYLLGALISELLTINLKSTSHFKWATYFVAFEMIVLLGIGFIPEAENTMHLVQVLINFLASMQFTTFKRAEGIPMATTFCTNHIRQIGISIANACKEKKFAPLKRGITHLTMIAFFFAGGVFLSLLTRVNREMSIFLCLVPLTIVLIMLIYGDVLNNRALKAKTACVDGISESEDSDSASIEVIADGTNNSADSNANAVDATICADVDYNTTSTSERVKSNTASDNDACDGD